MENTDKGRQLQAIGGRIRERRNQLGFTQDELHRRAGLSKSFISEVEGGKRAASGLNYLQLAEVLDVDVSWLLKGTGPAAPDPPEQQPPRVHRLLAAAAEDRGWSYTKTAEAAAMLNAVAARRTRGGAAWEPNQDYIDRLVSIVDQTEGD